MNEGSKTMLSEDLRSSDGNCYHTAASSAETMVATTSDTFEVWTTVMSTETEKKTPTPGAIQSAEQDDSLDISLIPESTNLFVNRMEMIHSLPPLYVTDRNQRYSREGPAIQAT
jgi:hypothetical protein